MTVEDRAQARQALLALLVREIDIETVRGLAKTVTRLAVTAEDRVQARQALLALLARETGRGKARQLADAIAGLSPTIADLGGSSTWPLPPTPGLLAAARHNSKASSWIASLALLPELPINPLSLTAGGNRRQVLLPR